MNEGIRKPDRMAIRVLAENNSAELRAVAEAGGNPYQKSLEHQDKINEFVATLSEDEAISFLNMYTDELNAITQKLLDDTEVINAKNEAKNHTAEAVGGTVVLIFLFFIIYILFR